MPIFRELIALSSELVAAVQRARPASGSSSCSPRSSRSTAPRASSTARRSSRRRRARTRSTNSAYEEIDPEIYGDTAVLVSRYRQTARLDGRDLSHRMHVTDIWVRRDGRWQIVRRHATIAGR